MDLHHHFQLHPVILLPLRPPPTYNNPQRRQITMHILVPSFLFFKYTF